MVTNPHTQKRPPRTPVANTQTGPITTHCDAKLSAQSKKQFCWLDCNLYVRLWLRTWKEFTGQWGLLTPSTLPSARHCLAGCQFFPDAEHVIEIQATNKYLRYSARRHARTPAHYVLPCDDGKQHHFSPCYWDSLSDWLFVRNIDKQLGVSTVKPSASETLLNAVNRVWCGQAPSCASCVHHRAVLSI